MAARRASVRLLKVLQQSGNIQPVGPVKSSSYVVSRSFTSLSPTQIADLREEEANLRKPRSASYRRLYTADGQTVRNVDHHEHEKSKMTSEGGGTVKHFGEATEEMKAGTEKAVDEGKDTVDEMKEKATDYAESVKDTANSAKQKTKETMGSMSDKADSTVGQTNEKVKETVSEGGEKARGATEKVKEGAKESAEKVKEKTEGGKEVVDGIKGQAAKEAETAKDMFKDMPQKTSETAQGLKEVVVEAAKAVKRDANKVAEKVGLKSGDDKPKQY